STAETPGTAGQGLQFAFQRQLALELLEQALTVAGVQGPEGLVAPAEEGARHLAGPGAGDFLRRRRLVEDDRGRRFRIGDGRRFGGIGSGVLPAAGGEQQEQQGGNPATHGEVSGTRGPGGDDAGAITDGQACLNENPTGGSPGSTGRDTAR